jgi:lysozyme
MNTISKKGLSLIMHFEQLHDGDLSTIGLQPKLCPANIWTVGYGRALRDEKGNFLRGEKDKAKALKLFPSLTDAEAEQMLIEDAFQFSQQVYKIGIDHKLTLNQNQFDALVSFAYNCGIGALYNYRDKKEMAVLRAIKNNGDVNAAFMLWVNAGGKRLAGLVRRRKSESHLYQLGEINFYDK